MQRSARKTSFHIAEVAHSSIAVLQHLALLQMFENSCGKFKIEAFIDELLKFLQFLIRHLEIEVLRLSTLAVPVGLISAEIGHF